MEEKMREELENQDAPEQEMTQEEVDKKKLEDATRQFITDLPDSMDARMLGFVIMNVQKSYGFSDDLLKAAYFLSRNFTEQIERQAGTGLLEALLAAQQE